MLGVFITVLIFGLIAGSTVKQTPDFWWFVELGLTVGGVVGLSYRLVEVRLQPWLPRDRHGYYLESRAKTWLLMIPVVPFGFVIGMAVATAIGPATVGLALVWNLFSAVTVGLFCAIVFVAGLVLCGLVADWTLKKTRWASLMPRY